VSCVSRYLVSLAGALLIFGCSRPTPPAPPFDPGSLDGARALDEARDFVALGPRVSGTPDAERAAAHIQERLAALGLSPSVDVFKDATPAGPLVFRNITARLEGATPGLIVLAGHYDTKGGISDRFVGANDSGSSTGLLLALAAALRRDPPTGPTLLLSFLDGEECRERYDRHDGLHGSRRMASRLERIASGQPVLAVIVVDMIGDRDLSVTIPRNSTPGLIAHAFDAAQAEQARTRFSLLGGAVIDDHVPFLERGYPAIDLIDFQYGSSPGENDYWHTEKDTMDKLSADSLQTVGRVVIRMINALVSESSATL